MRLLYIFSFLFLCGFLFTTSWAVKPEPVNEMDAMLKKIQQHTQAVGQATHAAHAVSEAMVESKVAEKQALKEAVVEATNKAQVFELKAEKYATTMMIMGVDTSLAEMDTLSLNNMMKLNGL
jgi:hypothetical protein